MEQAISDVDLQRISLQFRQTSVRLIRTDFREGLNNLRRFLEFVDSYPIIVDFIQPRSAVEHNIEGAIASRETSNHRLFDMPTTTAEEVSFTYQLLTYALEHYSEYYQMCFGYGFGTGLQNHVAEFNKLVVLPFVNHINDHLNGLMVERGIGMQPHFTVSNNTIGAFNFAQQGGQITSASSAVVSETSTLSDAVEQVLKLLRIEPISPQEQTEIEDLVRDIHEEARQQSPKRSFLRLASSRIQEITRVISASSALGQAVHSLIQHIQTLL